MLAGRRPFVDATVRAAGTASLPPAERRRTTAAIRLAMAAADASLAAAGLARPAAARQRLRQLQRRRRGDRRHLDGARRARSAWSRRPSSTTRSTTARRPTGRSASASRGASTSLGCWDATFAASLLHAAAKASDAPASRCCSAPTTRPCPPPLSAVRPTSFAFAAAMVLTPRPEPCSMAALDVGFAAGALRAGAAAPPSRRAAAHLPRQRRRPARCACSRPWPRARRRRLPLDYLDDTHLRVEVAPLLDRAAIAAPDPAPGTDVPARSGRGWDATLDPVRAAAPIATPRTRCAATAGCRRSALIELGLQAMALHGALLAGGAAAAGLRQQPAATSRSPLPAPTTWPEP